MRSPTEIEQQIFETLGVDDDKRVVEILSEAIEAAFRVGFEHAVAGGKEAAKLMPGFADKLPLVLYFGSEADRQGMIEACTDRMVELKIPERH